MIKFEMLTTEELEYICAQMPLSSARQYFQKNPKAFAEIKPGFRPEKLSDADTLALLRRSSNKPFISSFLENMLSMWLAEIQKKRDQLTDEGYSVEESLLLVIPESVFCENCDLYFKLIGQTPSEDYVRLFRDALSLRLKEMEGRKSGVQSENEQKNNEKLTEGTEKTIASLREQLSESKTAESTLLEELSLVKRQLTSKNEECDSLTTALREREELNVEFQAELEHYRRLASFVDEYVQDEASEFQHVSIGQIYHDYSGQTWISRLADIIDGEIVPFVLDETTPRYFSNRDRLFWKDGPSEDNAIGVWSWRADPNYSDPTKDYVTSEYNPYSKYIEIILLPQCKSISEVADFITDWFEKGFSGEKVLFTYTTASGTLEGLLCTADNMETVGDNTRLRTSVFMLPHYKIKQTDVIKLGGIRAYHKMSLGIPQSIYRVRTPYDVVKRMLLSRITIPALREIGLTKKEAQKCKHYLESVPTKTLVQELSDAYACTEAEAKGYIDGFIEHADTYLSENDLDINIISAALSRNEGLVALCKTLLSEEWENENSERIEEAQKGLAAIEQAKTEARQETEKLIKSKESLVDDLRQVQQKISDATLLATEVEKNVKDRIKGAQQNAAEFISQMAFISSFVNSGNASETHRDENAISVFRSAMNYTDEGSVDDLDTFEEELTENLVTIGYLEETAVEMAQAISFCICSRLPVVIGENATAIARCIAATIGGEELTEVFVGNKQTVISSLYELMDKHKTDYPLVYLVHGTFDGYSNTVFSEISNLVHNTTINAAVILSLQGVAPNMVTDSVWSNAFYIDGDCGIQKIGSETVRAVNPEMTFERSLDENEYKTRWKELQPFSAVLSNMQICLYAKYLASYGVGLQDSPTVLNQLLAVCRSSGTEERLLTLFHENGIDNGEKLVEQFL